jgi:acetaldehyde dehydrogenase (acetylating)
VPEQGAVTANAGGGALIAEIERHRWIERDVIVIADIERDGVARAGDA